MREKRALSQSNTSASDRKILYSETQIDVNEIERALLSRDHNLPGTSTDCFAEPQTIASKSQERRSKLRTALRARKRKNLAPRRPVSCDSALPRKKHCPRKQSRPPPKPTVPLKSSPNGNVVKESVAGPSGVPCSASQPRDGNENAPRSRRSSALDSWSSSSSTPIPCPRHQHAKRLTPRRTRSRASRTRKQGKVIAGSRHNLIYSPEGSHYCVTPSPSLYSSPSRTSSRRPRSSRTPRRHTASGHKRKHRDSSSEPSSETSSSSSPPPDSRYYATSTQTPKSRVKRTPSISRRSYSRSKRRDGDSQTPSVKRRRRIPSGYSGKRRRTPSVKRGRRSSSRHSGRRRHEISKTPSAKRDRRSSSSSSEGPRRHSREVSNTPSVKRDRRSSSSSSDRRRRHSREVSKTRSVRRGPRRSTSHTGRRRWHSRGVSNRPSVRRGSRSSSSYAERPQSGGILRCRPDDLEDLPPARTRRRRRRLTKVERYPKRRRISDETNDVRRTRRRRRQAFRRARSSASQTGDWDQDEAVWDEEEYDDFDKNKAAIRNDGDTGNLMQQSEAGNRRYICRVM